MKTPPNEIMVRRYRAGLGRVVGRMMLLLTTTGRKSGIERVTPLQYELVDGVYIVSAAKGLLADWVKNALANPSVSIQVGDKKLNAVAEVITNTQAITAFLEMRLKRHPLIIRMILFTDRISRVDHDSLFSYARKLVIVKLSPTGLEPS
jgi:deazaflavin-dependent oxidoreductase (nitroreductase family)